MKKMVGSFILTQHSSPLPLTCSASPFLSLSRSTWLPRLHCRPSPGHSPPSSFLTKSLFTPLSLSLGEPLILSIYLGFAMNIFVVVSLNLQVLWIFFPLNLFCNSRVSVWAWKSCCFFNSFLKKYSAFAINPLHGFKWQTSPALIEIKLSQPSCLVALTHISISFDQCSLFWIINFGYIKYKLEY